MRAWSGTDANKVTFLALQLRYNIAKGFGWLLSCEDTSAEPVLVANGADGRLIMSNRLSG